MIRLALILPLAFLLFRCANDSNAPSIPSTPATTNLSNPPGPLNATGIIITNSCGWGEIEVAVILEGLARTSQPAYKTLVGEGQSFSAQLSPGTYHFWLNSRACSGGSGTVILNQMTNVQMRNCVCFGAILQAKPKTAERYPASEIRKKK